MRKSILQLAIDRGSQPGGDLAEELGKLDDYTIASGADAEAVCEALAKIPYATASSKFSSDLSKLVGLFQSVEAPDSEGFRVLRTQGTAQLVRIFDASLNRQDANEDDLLYVLKILAMYGTRAGADRVVKAARKPLKPDGYMWSVILGAFSAEHPQREYVFKELRSPLPAQFVAIALLDSANQAALAGESENHPFDTESGVACLREWLSGADPDETSYAVSAVVALPFIDERWRRELLALAVRHPDKNVGLEAAWARAKSGDQAGIDDLAGMCLDINLSKQAQRYLGELDRADAIPEEVSQPDFQAKAEFANWLAHPNELGRPPDELEIVDHRTLRWPPDREPLPLWLIRYRLRDTTGLDEDDVNCGLVGSVTWCFFSYDLHQRPPEDAYALHCYWEMRGKELIAEEDVAASNDYANLLAQWSGPALESPRITQVAEMSPQLKYPQRLVALASAKIDGRDGWVVLDGARSAWYDPREFPGESPETTLLDLHVGRQLLGFTGSVDRAEFLQPPARRDPRSIVEAYERFLQECESGDERRRTELLTDWKSPLLKYFDKYVEAHAEVNNQSRSKSLSQAYERFLALARRAPAEVQKEAMDGLRSPLRDKFEEYVDALVELNRPGDVVSLIEFYAPRWDHNLGRRLLGSAAFKIGNYDCAEERFVRLHKELKDYCRSEEMSLLAEIWVGRNKVDDARDLLVDCLQKLVVMVQVSKHASDRKTFEEEFQHHRQTFLRLFPDLGEAELKRRSIPATTGD